MYKRVSAIIPTWLLRCSDIWASSLKLEGREDKQLGSLSREAGVDKVIGEVTRVLNLWKWSYHSWGKGFLPKKIFHLAQENGLHWERYPITRGISPVRNYLLWPEQHTATGADEVQSMWQKFVQLLLHTNPLATLVWKGSVAATVDEAIHQLEEYEWMTVFLPPSSQLWRNCVINCPVSSSNSEEICPTPSLYHSNWLQVSFSSKDDTEGNATGYPVVLLVGPLTGCEELRWKAYLNPRGTSTWIRGKKQMEDLCGKFLLQWTVSQAVWKDWFLVLILWREVLICFHKK